MFDELKDINTKPEPFEFYSAEELLKIISLISFFWMLEFLHFVLELHNKVQMKLVG